MCYVRNCEIAAHAILLDSWPRPGDEQVPDSKSHQLPDNSHWKYDGCSSSFLSFVFHFPFRHVTDTWWARFFALLVSLYFRLLSQVPVEHCLLAHPSLHVPPWFLVIPCRVLAVLWSLTILPFPPLALYHLLPVGFVLLSCSLYSGSALQEHPLVCTFSTHLLVLVLMTWLLFLICSASLCHFQKL